ncbi:MAG: ADP-glyceromanno-heptose 6-epimerase [Pseudomonadota bacterium]|nr:ADP-glyceromanno-heptose 6-epimerase [Pseudomonadota bacterium]
MIIVTGGAGFIGSNLIAGLEERGHRHIVLVDRLRDGEKWRNIARLDLYDIVHPDDLFDFLDSHASHIEMIFHMGAISTTTERDVDRIVRNNFRLSLDLWHWCVLNRSRFIYASSASTYGDGSRGFDDDISPDMQATLQPLNAYGWSKLAFDKRVAATVEGCEPKPKQWVGLKFFNVFGPNEYHKGEQSSVIPKLHKQIAETGVAKLFKSEHPDYSNGGQQRDFIWVGDCVNVMLWLAENPYVNGLFNVGTGSARSFADLAKAIFAAHERKERIEYVDMPEKLKGRYQYFTEADTSRLRAAGYSLPFTKLEDAIMTYVRDYLATDNPYI